MEPDFYRDAIDMFELSVRLRAEFTGSTQVDDEATALARAQILVGLALVQSIDAFCDAFVDVLGPNMDDDTLAEPK